MENDQEKTTVMQSDLSGLLYLPTTSYQLN